MITLERVAWDAAADRFFSVIRGNCPMAPGFYRDEVEVRGSAHIAVSQDGARIGSFVLRDEGAEAVIVAGAGRARGVDLTRAVLPVIERECARAGYEAVRFHTARAGLVAKVAALGWDYQETVMRKGLG